MSWGQPLGRGFSADAPRDWTRRGGDGNTLQKGERKYQRRPRAAAADAASAGADAGRAKTAKKKGASEEEDEEDEEDDSEDEDDEDEDYDMGEGNWGEKGVDPKIHRQSCIDGRDMHV